MKISIVGGAGFVGQSLGDFLTKKKYQVRLIDTQERLSQIVINSKGLELIKINYKSSKDIETAIKKSDVVINLFSKTEPISSMKCFHFDAEENILTNIRIFEAANKLNVKKIIFSSSGGTVYGSPKKIPITENSITNPISAYGISKLTSEKYLNLYTEINNVSLRISNAYGPIQLINSKVGIIAKILKNLNNSKKIIIYGNGKAIKDFVYIEDVCNAFYYCCKYKISSGVYNVGSGKGITINELIKLIFHITNKKTEVTYKNNNHFDIPKNVLNFSKFKKETKWKPKYNIEKGTMLMWKNLIEK